MRDALKTRQIRRHGRIWREPPLYQRPDGRARRGLDNDQ